MSSPVPQLCPSCGTPVPPDAAFCENCGAEVARPESQEGGASRPGEPMDTFMEARPEGSPHPARPEGSPHPARPEGSPPYLSDATLCPASCAPDAPFSLEWDMARAFIENKPGVFAWRMTPVCDLVKARLVCVVNGQPLEETVLEAIQGGVRREGTFPYIPPSAGSLSVCLRVEVRYTGRVCESFEATEAHVHTAYPEKRTEIRGAGSVVINAQGNTGINRFDGMGLSELRGAASDLWEEQRSVLARHNEWVPVAFSTAEIGRETVRLRSGDTEIQVVSGLGPVTFGRSSHRADVRLLPETPDGCPDGYRGLFVSGVHFTLLPASDGELHLRDGGARGGRWCPSTNRTALDGTLMTAPLSTPLSPGRTFALTLAPNAVLNGALSLTLETLPHGVASLGCDHPGQAAAVILRRADTPRRIVLVVCGGVSLDFLLGSRTGLRVGLVRGRLRLLGADGSSVRLLHLAGRSLPGASDIFVQ